MTTPPENVAAEAEQQRLANQGAAEQQRQDAVGEPVLDPNSPEGRTNAISRGDPVQLSTPEEIQAGAVTGVNATANESPVMPQVAESPQEQAVRDQQAAAAERAVAEQRQAEEARAAEHAQGPQVPGEGTAAPVSTPPETVPAESEQPAPPQPPAEPQPAPGPPSGTLTAEPQVVPAAEQPAQTAPADQGAHGPGTDG
jgi:hypothetical protein